MNKKSISINIKIKQGNQVSLQANYKAIDLVEFAESLKGISA